MSFLRTPPTRVDQADDPFAASGSGGKGKSKEEASFTPSSKKRNGVEAGLPEESPFHPLRRSLMQSQVENSSLSRRLCTLERTREEDDRLIAEQQAQIEKLLSDRRVLDRQREEAEKRAEDLEDEVAGMKQTHAQDRAELSRAKSKLEQEFESLRAEHVNLANEHVKLVSTSETTTTTLRSRITNLEREKAELLPYRDNAHEAGREVDRLMREVLETKEQMRRQSSVSREAGTPTQSGTDDDLRAEFRRQSSQLVTLQQTNAKLQADNQELRARRDNVEMIKSELKNVERKSRDKIRSLTEELDKARREMDSLTQAFAPPAELVDATTSSADLMSIQHRLSTLAAAHSTCNSTISAQKSQISDLLYQIENVSNSSQGEIIRLERRLEEAEREWRWAKEGREKAEAKLGLARQEIDGLRMKLSHRGDAGSASAPDDLIIQIAHLEDTIEQYKQVIENFEADSRDAQAKVILDLDLVKRADLDEALRRGQSLETTIQDLRDHIAELEKQNIELDKEVGELMTRVGSGEYNTKIWRCVQLGGGPAAKDWAIRTETLDRLKQENQALLMQIKDLEGKVGSSRADARAGGAGFVPRETYDRLAKEAEESNAAHEKRLLRLKEIFGLKSKEFLESVYSLLGWRIKFDPNGRDVFLTSMYAPKGKMGLTLRFTSSEGHFGTMLMTGGMARGLEDTRRYWVEDRQSVPGFLSQVTLEIFEKTTIGRGAGWRASDEGGDGE